MNDQMIMENILNLEKGVCGLYLHGCIESSANEVNSTFGTALKTSLTMQNETFDKMTAKGWYKTEQVEKQKIQQVKKSFAKK